MNATQEQWRPVVGFEGIYEVSDHGRVRSLDRMVASHSGLQRQAPGRVLRPWKSNRGDYPKVGLSAPTGFRKEFIHVLVLEAFVGPRPEGLVCCHNDGDSSNNRLSNLRWDTYSANNHDLVKHGRHWNAKKTHCTHGHEFTPENTRLYPYRGALMRFCIVCEKANSRKYKAKLKAIRALNPKKPGVKRRERCNRGHEFTPENTYLRPDGLGRSCRKCQRIRGQSRRGEKTLGSQARS